MRVLSFVAVAVAISVLMGCHVDPGRRLVSVSIETHTSCQSPTSCHPSGPIETSMPQTIAFESDSANSSELPTPSELLSLAPAGTGEQQADEPVRVEIETDSSDYERPKLEPELSRRRIDVDQPQSTFLPQVATFDFPVDSIMAASPEPNVASTPILENLTVAEVPTCSASELAPAGLPDPVDVVTQANEVDESEYNQPSPGNLLVSACLPTEAEEVVANPENQELAQFDVPTEPASTKDAVDENSSSEDGVLSDSQPVVSDVRVLPVSG